MKYNGYRITTEGKVYSDFTGREMSYDKRSGGALGIKIRIDGSYKNKLVHRLVAELHIPNPQNKPQVDHIDGNKRNNDITNLRWCTDEENQHFRHEQGNIKDGSRAKLVTEYRDGKIYRTHNSITSASRVIEMEHGCKASTAKKRIKNARYDKLNAYGSEWII